MLLDRAIETMCENWSSTVRPSNTKGCIAANNLGAQGDAASDGCQHKPENYSCRFTVCTPTFNRGRTLYRVYDSLLRQTCQDFEWLIIDDESTDDTAEVVRQMIEVAPFKIRYFWQRHGHKKTAVNNGAREARGELFLCWDSDDAAPSTALEDLLVAWESIPHQRRSDFSGVWGLCATPEGKVIGTQFPDAVFDSDYATVQYSCRVQGEKWGFVRTELLRKFPYPEHIKGFVPEGIVWARIGRSFKTRYINKIVRTYFDEADSLTRARGQVFCNAPGLALWAGEVLRGEFRHFFQSPTHFIGAAVNLIRFRLHCFQIRQQGRGPGLSAAAFLLVVCLSPVGFAVFLKDNALQRWPDLACLGRPRLR